MRNCVLRGPQAGGINRRRTALRWRGRYGADLRHGGNVLAERLRRRRGEARNRGARAALAAEGQRQGLGAGTMRKGMAHLRWWAAKVGTRASCAGTTQAMALGWTRAEAGSGVGIRDLGRRFRRACRPLGHEGAALIEEAGPGAGLLDGGSNRVRQGAFHDGLGCVVPFGRPVVNFAGN